MKRLHVSFNVADLDKSIGFYEKLFAQAPTVVKNDYAKWLLDDPRMNFVLEARGDSPGFGHAGIQVDEQEELQPLLERMQAAESPYMPEGVTACCYAKSEKSWSVDPDGVFWEGFYTFHQSEHRSQSEVVETPKSTCSCLAD